MSVKQKRLVLYFNDGESKTTNLFRATLDEAIKFAEDLVKNNPIYKYDILIEDNSLVHTKDYSD